MREEDFMKNIQAAQKLCSAAGNALINSKKIDAPTSKAALDPETFGMPVNEGTDYDRMFLSDAAYTDNSPRAQRPKGASAMSADRPITQGTASKSKVPDFIKQSMMNEVIDNTALSANPLDRIDLSQIEKTPAQMPKPRQVVTEQQVAQPIAVPSGVDYTIIKAIINECLDAKLKEYGISKEMLTENTLKTIHLKGGNIKLVDNSGNVYSAQLEKRGNINDRK